MAYISTIERMGIEKGFSQGISQGKQEGLLEGRQEGEACLLVHLLIRRFGSLPVHYRKQVAEANPDALLQWADRVLFAKSLEEVFQ